MSKQLDKELLEIAEWYTYHKGSGMDIDKKLEFLTKSIDFLLWALAKTAEDIQNLEGRRRNGQMMNWDPYTIKAVPNNLRTTT